MPISLSCPASSPLSRALSHTVLCSRIQLIIRVSWNAGHTERLETQFHGCKATVSGTFWLHSVYLQAEAAPGRNRRRYYGEFLHRFPCVRLGYDATDVSIVLCLERRDGIQ